MAHFQIVLILALEFNFSLDNDYKTFDSNEIIAKLNVNNFATEFNFIKENGKQEILIS